MASRGDEEGGAAQLEQAPFANQAALCPFEHLSLGIFVMFAVLRPAGLSDDQG